MRRRPFRPLLHLLEGALAWGFYGLLKLLPPAASSGLMGWLARTLGPHLPVSHVARTNLKLALPERAAEHEAILKACWENLGRLVGEFPHLHNIASRPDCLEIIGADYLEQAKAHQGAVIFCSGHFANWEMLAALSKERGIPLSLVYRPANNRYTDALYTQARRGVAHALYSKNRGGARQILLALKRGERLGMLLDQKMNDGVAVPFFGREAMTAGAIAELALKQHIPIYPIKICRLPGLRFCAEVLPPMKLPTGEKHAENVLQLLTHLNQMLEGWIREKPEQWFWLHRRWEKGLYRKA